MTNKKIKANTVFVFRVKMKNVSSANPHTIKYRANAAFYCTLAAPAAAASAADVPAGAYTA